jgi:hypothetical protein
MARSGTSVLARGLHALGVDFGNHLIPGNDIWNPKGFWEDKEIVYKINRGVLHVLQNLSPTTQLTNLSFQDNNALSKLNRHAVIILKKRMTFTNNWGFKDPRTAIILPFWKNIFTELNLQDHYIISVRNPLSSAYSYCKVYKKTDIEMGLILWLRHLISAIDETVKKKRIIVSYELLLQNPIAQLERMINKLSITCHNISEMNSFEKEFLDKALQHYEYTLGDLMSHPATSVSPLCIKVYELLMQIAKDQIFFDSDDFSCVWAEIKKEYSYLYPIYYYIDLLTYRQKKTEKILHTIKKSFPWKISYPFRVVDDLLRNKRINSRKKKKLARFYEE